MGTMHKTEHTNNSRTPCFLAFLPVFVWIRNIPFILYVVILLLQLKCAIAQKSILTSIGGVLARSPRVWQLFALKSGRVKPKTIHNWYSLLLWHARSIKEEDENHENSEGQQFHKYQQNKQPPQIIEHKKNPHQMTLEIHVQAWARHKMRGTQLVESQTGLFGIGIMRPSGAIGVPLDWRLSDHDLAF